MAHRLSLPHRLHHHCLGDQQANPPTPQCLALCRNSGMPCWFQVWEGPRAVLQEAEASGALDLTSCPESARPGGWRGEWGRGGGAGMGVEGPFSLSGKAPFSWRNIKTHTKRFHVVPALGLCPSRRINPRAARTDMSSQLCFHVCPQFQCHHTKSRLIVNRSPPSPPPARPPLPPPPSLSTSGFHNLSRGPRRPAQAVNPSNLT